MIFLVFLFACGANVLDSGTKSSSKANSGLDMPFGAISSGGAVNINYSPNSSRIDNSQQVDNSRSTQVESNVDVRVSTI